MGDAADEAFDRAMLASMDFDSMEKNVREACTRPGKPCNLVDCTYEVEDDDDIWLPFRCATCGERFDL